MYHSDVYFTHFHRMPATGKWDGIRESVKPYTKPSCEDGDELFIYTEAEQEEVCRHLQQSDVHLASSQTANKDADMLKGFALAAYEEIEALQRELQRSYQEAETIRQESARTQYELEQNKAELEKAREGLDKAQEELAFYRWLKSREEPAVAEVLTG